MPNDPDDLLPARRPRVWIPIVIVVSSLVVVALVVVLVTSIMGLVANRLGLNAPDQPLTTGSPPNPHAAAPLACPPECFDELSIEAAVLRDQTLEHFGFSRHDYPWGTYDPTSAGSQYRALAADWAGSERYPDECVFVVGSTPAAIVLDETDKDSADTVEWTGSHADADVATTLDQSLRIFPDTASATAYLETLEAQIDDCEYIYSGDGHSAAVTPAPALSLHKSCAAVGWVRTGKPGDRWRAYVFDIQRANLVVRIRVLTDGSMTETKFRSLVENYGIQLAALQPTAAP